MAVQGPGFAGPLVTASAAPHCPFRLTDDALQAVAPVRLCPASGLCGAAGHCQRRASLAVQAH